MGARNTKQWKCSTFGRNGGKLHGRSVALAGTEPEEIWVIVHQALRRTCWLPVAYIRLLYLGDPDAADYSSSHRVGWWL